MKTVFVYVVVCFSMFCTSCTEEKPQVGFLMDDFLSERWAFDSLYLTRNLTELGADLKVRVAYSSDSLQFEQAKELIEEGVDVLVLVPTDARKSCEIVSYAHDKGVKVICYERLIVGCDVDYYISFDGVKVGELQASYLTERVPKGNYMIISGPKSDHNSLLFKKGQMNVLQPLIDKGDVHIIYDKYMSEWIAAEAYGETFNFFAEKGDSVDAIIVGNDAMAEGVIDAYQGLGYDSIPTTGQDGQIAAIKRIVKGSQSMTVYKPLQELSKKASQLAYDVAVGKELSKNEFGSIANEFGSIPFVKIAPVIIDASNFEEVLTKYEGLE